jgi:hypothetical protein
MGRKLSKTLTLDEKKKIEILVAGGKTYHAVGKEIRRDPKTVKAYAEKPEVVEVIRETRGELAEMFEGLARRYLDSITDKDIEKINAYQRTIAAAAATDKARLLKNQSTANILGGGNLAALVLRVDEFYKSGAYNAGKKTENQQAANGVNDDNQVVEVEPQYPKAIEGPKKAVVSGSTKKRRK